MVERRVIKIGPLQFVNSGITPISRVIIPVTHLFSVIYWGSTTLSLTIFWAHHVTDDIYLLMNHRTSPIFTLRLNHTKGEAKVKQPSLSFFFLFFFFRSHFFWMMLDGIPNDTCQITCIYYMYVYIYIHIYMYMMYFIYE